MNKKTAKMLNLWAREYHLNPKDAKRAWTRTSHQFRARHRSRITNELCGISNESVRADKAS